MNLKGTTTERICNQCGRLEATKGPKCKDCFDLNKTFTARHREGRFSKPVLLDRYLDILNIYRLVVDNNFYGNLVKAFIPYKVKLELISKGYYPEFKDTLMQPINSRPDKYIKDTLEHYKQLYGGSTEM